MHPSKHITTNLPPDITESILHRLPAKSLGRFKSVSKTWHSLISDPHFIKTHAHFHHKNHHQYKTTKLILISHTKSLYSLHLNINHPTPTLAKEIISPIKWQQILGTCNGHVLANDEKNTIYLMNLTTKAIWNIPRCPFALLDSWSSVMYGFGYVSSSDDYKVVAVAFRGHKFVMFVSVYSLRDKSWRKVNCLQCERTFFCHFVNGVLVNEKVHWLVETRGPRGGPRGCSSIVAFSLESEEFSEVKLPSLIEKDGGVFFYDLVVVGGKLGLFLGLGAMDDLWVMEEYGVSESWRRFCIDGVERNPAKPMCFVEGSERDIVLNVEDRVFVYNVGERKCRDVGIVGGPSRFVVGGVYVESLESPKRIVRAT